MKNIIAKIRDCKPNCLGKTTWCNIYLSIDNFKEYIVEDVSNNLMPGQEVCIKVGNKFSKYVSYEDVLNYINEENKELFEDALNDLILKDNNLMHDINQYLSKY